MFRRLSRSLFNRQIQSFSQQQNQQKQCFYKTLNLSTDCSFDEIKQAYLQLAKKYHPDVIEDSESDSAMFSMIQEAYSILSDQQKRLDYDLSQGLRSEWKYNEGFDSSFGTEDQKYSDYQHRHNQKQWKQENVNRKMNEYFQKKYFQNHSYYTLFDGK